MPHIVEVDQSGKVEDTAKDTVLAFADGVSFAVLIPAAVKRAVYRELTDRGLREKEITIQLFSIGLYFLLREHIAQMQRVTIDVEYTGKDALIKERLISYLLRGSYVVEAAQISFDYIGKKSPAHILGISVLRGERKADLVLTFEEVLEEFGSKRKRRRAQERRQKK